MSARPRGRRRLATRKRVRRWFRRHKRLTHPLAVVVAALSVLLVALVIPRLGENPPPPGSRHDAAPVRRAAKAPARAPSVRPHAAAPIAQPSLPLPPAPGVSRKVPRSGTVRPDAARAAIVIDDLGQSFAHFKQLVGLHLPLSLAVIPGLPATARTVGEAARLGFEILLHQPMEPREEGGKDPGTGVLLTSMSAEAVRERVRASLAAVPGAVGVNNHMGSRFTEDAAGLDALMAELKEHGLFWLDSRTTAGTRGVEAAQAAGVPALGRDIFLDSDLNPDAIRRQVRKLIEAARKRGSAVAIGHPHPETIAVLHELRAELLASGVALVPVADLLRARHGGEPGGTLAAALSGTTPAGETAPGETRAAP